MLKLLLLATLMGVTSADPQGLYQIFLAKPEEGFVIDCCESSNTDYAADKCGKKLDQCGMLGRPALTACCTPMAIGFPKTAQTDVAKAACKHAKSMSKDADAQKKTVGQIANKGAADRSSHVGTVRFLRAKVGGYFCGGVGGCPRGVGLSVDCSVIGKDCGKTKPTKDKDGVILVASQAITCCNDGK